MGTMTKKGIIKLSKADMKVVARNAAKPDKPSSSLSFGGAKAKKIFIKMRPVIRWEVAEYANYPTGSAYTPIAVCESKAQAKAITRMCEKRALKTCADVEVEIVKTVSATEE